MPLPLIKGGVGIYLSQDKCYQMCLISIFNSNANLEVFSCVMVTYYRVHTFQAHNCLAVVHRFGTFNYRYQQHSIV